MKKCLNCNFDNGCTGDMKRLCESTQGIFGSPREPEETPTSFIPIGGELTPEETADLEALYTNLLIKLIDAENDTPTNLEAIIEEEV